MLLMGFSERVMSQENYAKAIDILMAGDLDYKGVCIELAKTDPTMFVKVAVNNSKKGESDLEERARLLYLEKGVVEAVKLYRNVTGASLKEAKDWVDARSPGWRDSTGAAPATW